MVKYDLVDTEERIFVRCVNSNDLDYPQLSTEEKRCTGLIFVDQFEDGLGQCNSCSRAIKIEHKRNRALAFVVHLIPSNIIQLVVEKISQYIDSIEPGFQVTSWKLLKGNQFGFFSILEYLPLQLLHSYMSSSNNHILGLAISNYTYNLFSQQYPFWPIISLKDLISNPKIVHRTIDTFLSDDIDLLEVQDCKIRLLKYVSQLDNTGTQFEKFCLELEREISNNTTRVRRFLAKLEENKLLAFRPLHFGGAGKPDIFRLPLFEFFRDFITDCKSIEIKQYYQSHLRTQDVSKALRHARRYNQDKIVIYTSDDAIPAGIWDDVIRVRDNEGRFVYFILDADFIAFLMVSFNIDKKLLP